MDPSSASANLWLHPCFWSKADVHAWLKWCTFEFSLAELDLVKFALNGKALMLLKKEDFMERAPYSGDVLYNTFQLVLRRHKDVDLDQSNSTSAGGVLMASHHAAAASALLAASRAAHTRSTHLPVAGPVPAMAAATAVKKRDLGISKTTPAEQFRSPSDQPAPKPQQHHCQRSPQTTEQLEALGLSSSKQAESDSAMRPYDCGARDELSAADEVCGSTWLSTDCRLWEFISRLLADNRFETSVRWEDKESLAFRIVNPARFAHLWGMQKNRGNMTYEKLSRALRYYYKMNIMEKIPGKRLTYRFLRPPAEMKQGRRVQPRAELVACSPKLQHSGRLSFASCDSMKQQQPQQYHHHQQHGWSPKKEVDDGTPDDTSGPLSDPHSSCSTPYYDDGDDAAIGTDGTPSPAQLASAEGHSVGAPNACAMAEAAYSSVQPQLQAESGAMELVVRNRHNVDSAVDSRGRRFAGPAPMT